MGVELRNLVRKVDSRCMLRYIIPDLHNTTDAGCAGMTPVPSVSRD